MYIHRITFKPNESLKQTILTRAWFISNNLNISKTKNEK